MTVIDLDARAEMLRRLSNRHRRLIGWVLGGALGLTYGMVTQWLNSIYMPGISFYQPPLGAWGNAALWTLFGIVLGFITAWFAESFWGIVWASTFSAALLITVNLPSANLTAKNFSGAILALVFLALPLWGMVVPLIAILRWAVNRDDEAREFKVAWWRRLGLPIVLLIAVGLIGSLSAYPPHARTVIVKMDRLVQAGLHASSPAQLPKPFQSDTLAAQLVRQAVVYTLEWKNTDINRYAIPYSPGKPGMESVVIARLPIGEMIVCLFPDVEREPECKGF